MCGIAGVVHLEARSYREQVGSMLDSIRYRGPDGSGIHDFAHCTLGHVRLSIVDLANGSQPMLGGGGTLGLVFNGEIYGYRELRKELAGYPFRTDCDTEVLLALYETYGPAMMEKLPGMFAFALWDERTQSLFCARDRFGEKPFYYAWGRGGEFIFASEIKAILATGLVDPEVDSGQVWHFMNCSYVYPTRTIYKNIHILPSAHMLTLQNGQVRVEPYWKLPATDESITEQEAVEEFRRLFRQAVKRQLVADVPVGAFLSGGLDSGSVVAQAAQLVPKVTTISFAFREGVDESSTARTMAERYHTNHIELRDIDFDIAAMLVRMQEVFDEPMADPANIPAYLIAKAARKHVKVVLTGDAGDEILGGYDLRYLSLAYLRKFQKMDVPLWRMSYQIGRERGLRYRELDQKKNIYRALGWDTGGLILQDQEIRDLDIRRQAVRWMKEDTSDIASFARRNQRMLTRTWNKRLGLAQPEDDYFICDGMLASGELDNAIRTDLLDYLTGNGFVKTDRTTMAVSLESRTPFCDKDLAEFCIRLPFSLKVHGKTCKYILRKAMGEMWTDPVRRGVKNGFSPPFGKWLRESRVAEMEHHYLCDKQRKVFDLLDYDGVQRLLKNGRMIWPEWSLLQLSMWMETHPCCVS